MFSAFAWYLASLKKQHSSDLYFRGAEAEWERETGAGIRVYLIGCVFLEYTQPLCCRRAGCFSSQDFGGFLPIKQALISVTVPELRGCGLPGCSFSRAVCRAN